MRKGYKIIRVYDSKNTSKIINCIKDIIDSFYFDGSIGYFELTSKNYKIALKIMKEKFNGVLIKWK